MVVVSVIFLNVGCGPLNGVTIDIYPNCEGTKINKICEYDFFRSKFSCVDKNPDNGSSYSTYYFFCKVNNTGKYGTFCVYCTSFGNNTECYDKSCQFAGN